MKSTLSTFFCFPFYSLVLIFTIFIFNATKAQTTESQEIKAEYSTYKNRVSFNLLAFTSGNLVTSYERAFKNQAIWVGFNYHLNGLLKEEDRNMASLAVEYQYYFFANKTNKFSNGLFGGVYAKYRMGEEIKRLALVKLFELGKIPSGKAAQILEITRIAFFDVLARYGVDVNNDVDEESLKEVRKNV